MIGKKLFNFFIFTFLSTITLISNRSSAQNANDTIVRLSEVEITDSIQHHSIPLTTLWRIAIEQVPSADLGEILRLEPNLSGIRKGGYAIDPVVRGFRYSQVNIHLDEGIHIEGGCPNRMDPVLSHVEPEEIQRIEIIRGPYLFQYGPSPAASIRVITREPNPFAGRKLKFTSFTGYDANRNGFRQHISLSGSGNKLYYRVAAGIKEYGNYTDGNGNEWTSSFKKRNVAADLGYKLSQAEMLTFSYKGSFGRNVMFPVLQMDEIADNTHIFSALYTKKDMQNPDNHIDISGFYTKVYHEMDNSFRPQYTQITPPYTGLMQAIAKVNTNTTGVRISKQHKTGNLLIKSGIDTEYTWKDGTRHTRMIMQMDGQEFVSEKKFNLWKDAYILNSGLYTSASAKSGNFSYEGAFRLDLNHSNSEDTLKIIHETTTWFKVKPVTKLLWSMAASSSWQINNSMSLSLGLARGARSPDLQERYIKFLATGYDRYDYLGNPDLKPEVNYQADLMLDYHVRSMKTYVNLFRSEVRNFITGTLVPPLVARPVSMGAPGVKHFNNIGRAVLYGFEAGLTSGITDRLTLAFSAGYTYAYFPEIEKIILENGQATGSVMLKNDPIAEIPALDAMLRTTYILFKGILQPVVEIHAVADQNHVSDASYEATTPGYLLANISLVYKPCRSATLTAGVNNLFNKAYYDHLNRKLLGTTGKLYEPGRTLYINLKIKI